MLITAGSAQAGRVAVLVVPKFDPARFEKRGAVGLLVPGSGTTVTRRGALASLVRGRVVNALLGGRPRGRPLIRLAKRPGPLTIYVSLPPPGRHHNTRRYPIAVVGGGYHGILVSSTTRIDGLVSVIDVAPTALSLERGRDPRLRTRADPHPARTLVAVDSRLRRAHDARAAATIVLGTAAVGFALLGTLLRLPLLVRAGLVAAPLALVAALFLSGLHVYSTLPLALLTAGGALALGATRATAAALAGVLLVYLVVLSGWTSVNSLSAIGPHPDGGVRFYGITNEVETLLLVPLLVPIAALGIRALPAIGLLGLAVVALSRTGADGGGAIVFAAGLITLAARLRPSLMTPRRTALLALAAIVVVAALVGIDAAAGGHSHLTHSLRRGPVGLFHDFTRRAHLSYLATTSSWHAGLTVLAAASTIVAAAILLPRFPVGEALLVALAVSMLVNDTPTDVLGFGAGAYVVVWTWERLRAQVN